MDYTLKQVGDMIKILPVPMSVCEEDLLEIYSQEEKNESTN